MECWEWEFATTEVVSGDYVVTNHGPLHGPITGFNVKRDKALDLVLETTSTFDSTSSATPTKPGMVFISNEEVQFAGEFGSHAVATGLIPRRLTRTTGRSSETIFSTETSSIQSLRWQRQEPGEINYLIEWVENLSGPFVWPDADDITKSGEKRRTLRSPSGEVVFSAPIQSGDRNRTCVHLIVEEFELFVGVSRAKPEHIAKPGFILYKGAPDESTRRKIRDCLSFCLGNYLIYLGHTNFDNEWFPVSFNAQSGHALVEEAPNLVGMQPAPLGQKYLHEITSDSLGRMVSSLYRSYDVYRLRSVFWSYWHALAAPVHMAAAHFGAAIESLQKTVFNAAGSKDHNKIVADATSWKDLCQAISNQIASSNLTNFEKQLLVSRAQNMNCAPQGVVADRLFKMLGLNIGTLERSVWINRNRAAHGGSVDLEAGVRLIRENKVLRVMMNRILLAIGNGSDAYYDYYTIGHPLRSLADSVPDDR